MQESKEGFCGTKLVRLKLHHVQIFYSNTRRQNLLIIELQPSKINKEPDCSTRHPVNILTCSTKLPCETSGAGTLVTAAAVAVAD